MGDLSASVLQFVIASGATVGLGIYLTFLADELADRSALGRAFVGAVLLGAFTSLGEIGTSITASVVGHAELAVTNAIGSIAAQTVFIAFADFAYRRANLEHAAASEANLVLGAVLNFLLILLLAGSAFAGLVFADVHLVSFLLVPVYVFGMYLVSKSDAQPMWRPRATRHTNDETAREIVPTGSMGWLWLRFLGIGVAVAVAGGAMADSGIEIAAQTGLTETFVGALLTGVSSSMPELITAVTAVRIGALSLALANIIGGNAFDVVIIGLSDFAFREGSIFAYAGDAWQSILTITLMMNAIVIMGLLRRQQHGIGNIGLEGAALIGLYVGVVVVLVGGSDLG